MDRDPLLPRHVPGLARGRYVEHERVAHDPLQLPFKGVDALEEPGVRHEGGEWRRAADAGYTRIRARAEWGGHEREGALVEVDVECDLGRAARALPVGVHVGAEVDGPAKVHRLAAAVLPLGEREVAPEETTMEDSRDCEL